MTKIQNFVNKAWMAIGGINNEDVYRFLYKRPKIIRRAKFFEEYLWAVWVSGLKRKSAEGFLDKCDQEVFDYEFVARKTPEQWEKHFKKYHKPLREKARSKWIAVYSVANMLDAYKTEREFREDLFGGKTRSKELNTTDAIALYEKRIPWVGKPNAHFIVRNIGGEAIKCDRWLEKFIEYYNLTLLKLDKLAGRIKTPHGCPVRITPGLIDLIVWCYCEQEVVKLRHFKKHFMAMKF